MLIDFQFDLQLYVHRPSGIVILGKRSDAGRTGTVVSLPQQYENSYTLCQHRTDWQGFVELCGSDCVDRDCNGCQRVPSEAAIEVARKTIYDAYRSR